MFKLFLAALLAMSLQADMISKERSQDDSHSFFSKGSKSIGIKLGSASIGDEDYMIAGLSGNYFVRDSLSVGLGYEKWFSGDPDIDKITLESTYFIEASDTIRPYAGVLCRRILISGRNRFGKSFDDTNSYGGRAGVAFVQDNFLLSAGVVYEKYDTTQRFFDDSETYVEITIGFAF